MQKPRCRIVFRHKKNGSLAAPETRESAIRESCFAEESEFDSGEERNKNESQQGRT